LQRSIIAPAERVTNLRWAMAALVAALVLAVSVDGVALVLGGWSSLDRLPFALGMILAQLPAGLLLDRFGVRRTGTIAALLWVAGTVAAAFAGDAVLPLASVVVGVATAAFLPLAMKSTASWFPRLERARATAIVIAAANAPIVLVLAPFTPKTGDGPPAIVTIGFAVIVTLVFLFAYRDADDARVTYAERTHITDGGAQPVVVMPVLTTLGALVGSRAVWIAAFAFGAFGFAFGLGAIQMWGVPDNGIALLVNLLVGGVLVDALVRRGATRTRNIVLVLGSLCGCAEAGILGTNATVGGLCTAIALFGFAAAQPVAWSVPGLLAPRGAVGTFAAILGLATTIGATAAWWGGLDSLGAAIAAGIAAILWVALGRIEAPRATVSVV